MTDPGSLIFFCQTKDPEHLSQLTKYAFSLLVTEAEKHREHPLAKIIMSHKNKKTSTMCVCE